MAQYRVNILPRFYSGWKRFETLNGDYVQPGPTAADIQVSPEVHPERISASITIFPLSGSHGIPGLNLSDSRPTLVLISSRSTLSGITSRSSLSRTYEIDFLGVNAYAALFTSFMGFSWKSTLTKTHSLSLESSHSIGSLNYSKRFYSLRSTASLISLTKTYTPTLSTLWSRPGPIATSITLEENY